MRRRELTALACGLSIARIGLLLVQTAKVWRIGYLATFSVGTALRGGYQAAGRGRC